MSMPPGACGAVWEAGSRAGRQWAGHCKQKHQAQEHIRVPGGNIWSARTPHPSKQGLTMALTQPCRHTRPPGWEMLPERGWQLPSALQQMLKHRSKVLPAHCSARSSAKPASTGGDRQVPVCKLLTRASTDMVQTSLPAPSRDWLDAPEQHHAASVLLNTNVHASDAMHVSA